MKETDYNRVMEDYDLVILRALHSNKTSIFLIVFSYVVDEVYMFSNQMMEYVMGEEYSLVGCDAL
jgi:hypothetical protein